MLAAVEGSGWFQPTMPRTGRPLSVRMGNLGPLGWVADASGYRYQPTHPDTGRPWPPLPASLLALWDAVTGWPAPPEACLVNLYRDAARMGLHQDRDEADLAAPVLSVSLGDTALFRLGGTRRGGPTRSLRAAPAATWWCWAGRRASASTASTASCPAARTWFRAAAGST